MKKLNLLSLVVIGLAVSCKKEAKIASNDQTEQSKDGQLSVFQDRKIIPNPLVEIGKGSILNFNQLINSQKTSSGVLRDSAWSNGSGKTIFIESDDIMVSNENADLAYTGAIFNSKSIVNNYLFDPISVREYDVLPIRASLSIPGTNVGGAIQSPDMLTMRDFVGQVVARQGNVPQINSFSYTSSEFTDYNELKYTFGANVDIGKIASIAVNGGGTKIKGRTGIIAKFVQENFTVDMSLPKKTELISPADANAFMAEYAPVYINSVTYGRFGVFMAETDASYQDFNVAFKAGLNIGIVKSDVNVTSAQKALLDRAKITIYMKFGPGKAYTATVNSYDGFKAAILAGADVASDSYGGPISFRMRNLKNFALFKTIFKINLPK
ncbi:thiol-activated cytolysin family protein [Pedobacter cryoconitis]|uniref:Thiol-activated cytolysin n=1 Tax=Pedobacter cryoconitis TaxID=188932 RepID=A0A327SCI7_9SPHI|nr:thiol-activated cytolysin family protein [Pedobacter cryoconitis]RAJ26072.1 thiol-activated cytolysin [Pedobacter cryoconitis]